MAIRRERRLQERELEKSKKYVKGFYASIIEINKTEMSEKDKAYNIEIWYKLIEYDLRRYKTIEINKDWLRDVLKNGKTSRPLVKSLI